MGELRFGYAEACINPGPLVPLEGYEHRYEIGSGNAGINDDLLAKALTLEVDGNRVLILSVDLCLMPVSLATEIRAAVAGRTSVDEQNVLLAATHTHSGPVVEGFFRVPQRPDEMQAVAGYVETLKQTIVSTAAESGSRLFPASMTTMTARAVLGYNRRCGQRGRPGIRNVFDLWENRDAVPADPIDPDIPILMLERQPDSLDSYLRPVGYERIVLLNPSYHPVVLGHHSRVVSADYPGAACRSIQESIGEGTRAMVLLGACADTHPWLAIGQNVKAAEIVGRAMGYTVTASLAARRSVVVDRIRVAEETVCGDPPGDGLVVQAIGLGDVGIIAVSAECFTQLGHEVRRSSPFRQTIVCTVANGCIGYLPPRDAYEEGGYEVVTEAVGRLGLAERVTDTARRILATVRDDVDPSA